MMVGVWYQFAQCGCRERGFICVPRGESAQHFIRIAHIPFFFHCLQLRTVERKRIKRKKGRGSERVKRK